MDRKKLSLIKINNVSRYAETLESNYNIMLENERKEKERIKKQAEKLAKEHPAEKETQKELELSKKANQQSKQSNPLDTKYTGLPSKDRNDSYYLDFMEKQRLLLYQKTTPFFMTEEWLNRKKHYENITTPGGLKLPELVNNDPIAHEQRDGEMLMMQKPEDYGAGDYLADAFAAFELNMNQALIQTFEGKKIRLGEYSDMRDAVDLAFLHEEELDLCTKYDNLGALIASMDKQGINAWKTGDIMVTKGLLVQQREQIRKQLSEMNGYDMSDFDIRNHSADLLNAHATDEKSKRDLEMTIGGIDNKILRPMSKMAREITHGGLVKAFTPVEDLIRLSVDSRHNSALLDTSSWFGNTDTWFGDDVQEGLEDLRGYINADKETRKKMSENFNRTALRKIAYWDKMIEANRKDLNQWLSFHKVSDYFNNKAATADPSLITWNGIFPSINSDAILYSGVQQLGYSASSWDKQTASMVLQTVAAATTGGTSVMAAMAGGALGIQGGVDENNMEVAENFEQRKQTYKNKLREGIQQELINNNALSEVIAEMRMIYADRPDVKEAMKRKDFSFKEFCINEIAEGRYTPVSQRSQKAVADAEIDFLKKMRAGSNLLFDRDMAAVTGDELFDMMLYSKGAGKVFKGIGSATSKMANKGAKWVFLKMPNKGAAIKGAITGSKPYNFIATRLRNVNARDRIASTFSSIYDKASSISPVVGTALAATGTTAREVGRQVAKTKLWQGIRNSTIKAAERIRGTQFGQAAENAIKSGTEFVRNLPREVLDGHFTAQRALARTGHYAKQIGKFTYKQALNNISEAIEEGKQYQNAQEWVNSLDQERVESFWDTYLHDATTGLSLTTAALGVPFGARWGLAAKDLELYKNMVGGWLGGMMHNTAVMSIANAGNIKDAVFDLQTIALDRAIRENAYGDQTTSMNKFMLGQRLASLVAASPERFLREFDAFVEFNKQEREKGRPAYTDEELLAEREYAQRISNLVQNPLLQRAAKNAGIKKGSQEFGEFVSAYAQASSLHNEDAESRNEFDKTLNEAIDEIVGDINTDVAELSSLEHDLDGQLGNSIYNKLKQIASNAATGSKDEKEKNWADRILEAGAPVKEVLTKVLQIRAYRRLLDDVDFASNLSQRSGAMDVNWIKSLIQDRINSLLGDKASKNGRMLTSDVDEVLGLIEGYLDEDTLKQLDSVNNAILGHELQMDVSRAIMDGLLGNQSNRLSLRWYAKLLRKVLGLKLADPKSDASEILGLYRDNLQAEYDNIDNVRLEYMTRQQRKEEEKRLAIIQEEADKRDLEDHLNEASINPLDDEILQEGSQEQPQPITLTQPELPQTPPETPPSAAQQPTTEPLTTPTQPESQQPTPTGESQLDNRMFTEDALNDAVNSLKSLLLGNGNNTVDSNQIDTNELFKIGRVLFGYYMESGITSFTDVISNVYRKLTESGIEGGSVLLLAPYMRSWYGAAIYDVIAAHPDQFDQSSFDDAAIVAHTNVEAYIQSLIDNDAIEDRRKSNQNAFEDDVRRQTGAKAVVHSYAEVTKLKDMQIGDVVAVVTPGKHVYLVTVTDVLNGKVVSANDQDGIQLISLGTVLSAKDRNRLKRAARRSTSAQDLVFELLLKKIKKDNKDVVSTTDYHYVIKENGKLVLYRRVHTILRDQYEELDDVVDERNKLYDELLDAITDRNFGKINLLLLNTNITDSQRDVYIDILKQDDSNDAEVAEALATIATRKEPGISVALGTIIDDLARQFFDSELAHDLTYENCKVTYNGVTFNISQTMSKDKFEALLNDFQRFKDLYPGCKFSTTRHTWHTTITDDSGNKIHVAGETDMIGVTEDGRMFIVDFKTSNKTFTESTITDSDGNVVPVGPFVDAHTLFTGQKARFSTKTQYARQLSLYLRIMQLEMPDVQFTNNPLIILPVGIRYAYRVAEENLKRIMNGEPVTLEMLFANAFVGRYTDPVSGKQEPLSIELPVQTDIIDGFFDKEDTNEDLTRRREGSLQEVNTLIQAATNLRDLLNRVINSALNIVNYVAKSLLLDANQKLIAIQEQLQELQERLEDELLPQSQIDEIEKDIAELTERIQELEQTVETRMIEVDELNALTTQAHVVDTNIDERAADKQKLYDSINEMFRLYTIYTSPGGNTVENYDKLSVAVKAMSDAADQFEAKYGNTDEGLNTARKNKAWFDSQKRPGTTSQATTNRPQAQQPTSTGWGWRDHNTVDNRELGNAKALDDPSISLADCAAKPDFNKKAVFEYVRTSANKYGATLICHVTYDGHDFGNITIQVASNKKGQDILVTLLNLLNQLKQGQRIVLTGMIRTMGRIEDTDQHNPLDNKALTPNGIYNVSTETSQFTFGFGKWYKPSGKVRVETYDQATGRSSMIYEFPSTRGAIGSLFAIIQPDYANPDGTMSLPIAHPVLQQTINEKEALFLIDMLLSNSTPAYEVSIGNGVTDNIPLSHRDIISLFIPYGHASYVQSRTGGRMAGAHVYVQMNGTRAVFSGKNEHDDNIWERPFDLSTESGRQACVEYLQTVWIQVDKDVAGCRLGQANNKNHPFKTLASWFNNPRHAGVDEIRIGDTRMVFRRADFKDPSNANDKLGMSGLAWLMRNGYLTTTFSHLTHPRVSFLDAAIEQESTDKDEPIAPQIDEIEEDATELEMDADLDVDDFLDEGLSMNFVNEHKQRKKAKRTVTKEEAVKRLHKIFGKNVSVEVVENIADFVRNTSANAVGKVVGYTMYLAERAQSGTEYHEAFHIVQDYLLPDSVNRQLMRGAKKAYAKKLGKEAAENATDKLLEEFCANQCASYFLKTEKIHFSLKHPFEYIQQHYEVFKHVGSFRMYLLYLTMSHGAFKMFDYSSEKQKKANKEHLKYQIRGVGMEHIYDDRMYNALIRSFVYYIMYMLNIESIGTNIDELDLSGDIVDKKLVRRKANGHKLTMSVREVLHASCKNPAGHAAIDELLDNWEVIKPDVIRYLDDIGIDYDEDAEKRREDLLNGDEDDMNDTNHLDNHTKSSYETSHFARAKKGVRFFTSLIKEYFINDEGRPEPTRNELGLYQFMDNKEVINKMLGDCHDVTSVSELVERLAKLSKTSPMYKQIYLIIKQSYDHQTRKDGSLNANVEQFVTQVFNLISCTQNHFKRIQANRNRRTKLYTISIEDCGLEYEALTYRRDWGRMMLYGGTVLFDIDEDGKMVPSKKHPDAIKKLGAAYDLLDTIRDQFTELNIHNLLEKGATPTLQIKYRGEKRTINVTNEDDLQILKTHIVDVFNTIGILVSRAEFEYYLKEKYKDCNSDFERMRAMFQDTREGAIYQLWLSDAGCPIKKVNGEWVVNYDDNNVIYGSKGVHVADMYTSNSFMIGLSNAAYRYRHMTTELSVLVSKGDKYYVMSENNLISDVVNEMSKNKPFIDLLNKFCYNIITEKSENPDGTVSTSRIGSLLMKEVLGARESGSNYNMRICSPVMFKTDNNKDDGLGYFDISEREDYVLKANILENGYIILPTMSDKKTWCYIETGTGILPGIDYKADDEHFDISGTSAAEQLLEYALTERASIEQTLQQVKLLPDDEKVDNFHNGAVIEDVDGVLHQIANGTVFASLTGVYVNGEYKSFNRMLDENGKFVGPEKNLELADKYFFSKSRLELIAMLKELVSRQSDKEVDHMLNLGLIKKDEIGQYVNVGLNNAAIMRIAKHIAGGNSVYPGHISQAIKVYAEDITYKSIMSLQEVERVFSGHPGFFKYKFDKKGRLVDRYSDEFKRFGGLISTGVKNNLEIKGLPEDGMYNQAEVDNDEIGSDQIDYIRKVMSEAEWKAAYRRIFGKEPDENVSIDKIKEDILGYDESIYKATEAAIDAETGSYAKKIDVADGGAYISPQMTEWLLRMCGEFDYKVQQAFKILMDPSKATDALAVAKSYKLIVTKVIGAQKYTAYGMRLSSDGKTTIPYYNKMALFPVFKCIATGEFAKIYEQMESHKDVHGNAMPIHLLAIKSAVKLGGQGSQKHSSDDSFTFNAYKQPFDRIRKQFNTNPHHKEDLSMGTQMVKVALAALNKTGEYIDSRGRKVTGELMLKAIMDDIKLLGDIGNDEVHERLYDEDGHISVQKLSKFLNEILSSRDSDKSIIDTIQYDEDKDSLKRPLSACSRLGWLLSLLVSFINKKIAEIHTKGNAFFQRSIWKMEGPDVTIKDSSELGNTINNGDPLLMIIEDGPAKGAMDCVLTIDYFNDVLKEAGLDKASFVEQKKALEEAGIIGKNAKAMFIGYRIPTQAVSSIHPLRCVDVLPVIQHNIFLPKEFTKITGSDFDIDKIFIASLNIKLQKNDDGWYNDVEAINEDKKLAALDRLIKNYIEVLRHPDAANIQHRSIDNDTDLITNKETGVLHEIYGDNVSDETLPYDFYCMRTLTGTKNLFLTGKVGIGPYALNNNSHILTMLYNVSFGRDNIMSQIGFGSLHRTHDEDGNSILSWLSALINAHVDVAKDAYITKLNVNPMTYNLVSLLVRTGVGKNTFYFTTQPIMFEMANEYAKAQGLFMQEEGKSKWAIRTEAKRKAAEEYCGKALVDEVESYMLDKEGNASEEGKEILEYILRNKDVLLTQARGNRSDVTLHLDDGDKTVSHEEFLAIIYACDKILEKPAQLISNLVQYTKIDTKKQGKNVSEQVNYLRGVAELFDDAEITEYLTGQKLDKNEIKSKKEYGFAKLGLKALYNGSFIGRKTKQAIFTFLDILSGLILESTPGFQVAVSAFMTRLGVEGVFNADAVSKALLAQIKSKAIMKWAMEQGIDPRSLVSGKDSLYDRLNKLKCRLQYDPDLEYLRYEDGTCKNALLLLLISDESWTAPVAENLHTDPIKELKFLRLFESLDINAAKRDYIIQAWQDLYEDDLHPELQQFAKDLFVYAFVTSGDRGGSTDLFSYAPNCIRDDSGYSSAIAQYILNLKDKGFGMAMLDEMFDDVVLNNYDDYTFCPTVTLDDLMLKSSAVRTVDSNGNVYTTKAPVIVVLDTVKFSGENERLAMGPLYIKVKNDGIKDKSSHRQYTVYKCIKRGEKCVYAKVNPKGYSVGRFNYYEFGEPSDTEFVVNETSLKVVDLSDNDLVQRLVAFYGNNIVKIIELLQGPFAKVLEDVDTTTKVSGTYPVPSAKDENTPLDDSDSTNENQPASNASKTAEHILATIAPFYNLTYDEYSKLDKDERENMRNKFHAAANKIALLLGLKAVSTMNLGSYLFKDGSTTKELSYTFQFNNANVDDVRLFSCLLGDIGYEDLEAVITSRIAEEGETPDAMCAVIYINDVRAARKTLEDVGVKNFSLNADTKTITIYSFDAEDYDKVEELSLKLKENNNHGETKTAGAITTLDDRDAREKLYRTWLESHQNGPEKGSDLYNLVSTALRNVVVFGNKNVESGRLFVKPEGQFKEKLSELADLAFSVAEKFGFKFKELNDASENTSGRTMADSATIGLNPRFDLGNTIFHEILHSVTTYLLPEHSFGATDGISVPQNVLDAISRLDSLLFDAGEYIYRNVMYNPDDLQLLYSLQSLAEFIAELSNERLLEVIQNVGDVNLALDDCITIVKHADKHAFDVFSKKVSTARKFIDAYKTATVFTPSKKLIEYMMNTLNSNTDSEYVKLELSELDDEDVSTIKKNAAVKVRVGGNVLYGIWLTDRESAQSSGKATLVVLSPSYLSKNAIVTQKDNENFVIVKSLTPATFDLAKVQDPFRRMLVQKALSKGVDHVYRLILNEINKTLLEYISPTSPTKLTTLNIISRYTGEDGVPRYYLNKSVPLAVDPLLGISSGDKLLDQKAKKVSEVLTKVLHQFGLPEDFMWLRLFARGYYLYINKYYLTQYNGLDSSKVRTILALLGESCKTQCGL